jgi:hypothetical protein
VTFWVNLRDGFTANAEEIYTSTELRFQPPLAQSNALQASRSSTMVGLAHLLFLKIYSIIHPSLNSLKKFAISSNSSKSHNERMRLVRHSQPAIVSFSL